MRDVKELIEELSVYEKKEVCPDCGKEPCECVCPKCGEKECKCESVNEDEAKDADNKREFCDKLEEIIDKEFTPVREKLINLVATFKELYPDTNEASLPRDISRSVDSIALCAGHIFDILNDDKRTLTKIRKALGYNG
jgi:hypothetical protein